MEIRFDEKVVMVTGASTGIGAAIARGFGDAGAKVVVHYNASKDAAERVAEGIKGALLVQADVRKESDIDALVEQTMQHFGRIDILVNNAGALVQRVPIESAPNDIYHHVMDVNMTQTFQMCRRVIPIMKEQGDGNIINMSSISARHGGGGNSVLYSAAKGAVSTFTRGLAKELATDKIRVNALAPGIILTPFQERYTEPDRLQAAIDTVPMQRAGTAEECVGATLFLASEKMSSYVTGQIIEINGGQLTP